MNSCVFSGKLTKDIDLKFAANSGTAILKNTIAIDRQFKSKDGKRETDFINLIIFGKTAEYLANYADKGKRIEVRGHMQSGSYENKEGKKIYTMDCVVDEASVIDYAAKKKEDKPKDEYEDMTQIEDGEIPF